MKNVLKIRVSVSELGVIGCEIVNICLILRKSAYIESKERTECGVQA